MKRLQMLTNRYTGIFIATLIVLGHQACSPIGNPITNGVGEFSSSVPGPTLDTTAPIVTLNLGAPGTPAAITTSTDAVFTFGAVDSESGIQRVECRLDSAIYATCSSTTTQIYSNLAVGPHLFYVRAIDNAGNQSTPLQYAWQINSPPPTSIQVTINTKPTSPTNSTSTTFQFSAMSSTGGTNFTFLCRIDNGSQSTCGTNVNSSSFPAAVTEGTRTFEVIARDSNNNSSAPVTFTWVVDTTKPNINVTSRPTSSTSTSAVFNFSSTDALSGLARTECALDAAAFTSCANTVNLTALSVGSHTFQIRATDRAGNAQLFSHQWDVQNVPTPPAPMNMAWDIPSTREDGTTLNANEIRHYTVYVSVNGGAFNVAATNITQTMYSYSTLTSGQTYSFKVTVTDTSGSESTFSPTISKVAM